MTFASRREKATVVICFALLIASACSDAGVPNPEFATKVASSCPSLNDAEYWLPKSAVFAGPDSDRIVERIAPSLEAAGEPPLWCGDRSVEEYRAVWIPANRPAIIARLQLAGKEAEIVGIEFADPRTLVNPPGSSLGPRGNRWAVKTRVVNHPSDQQVRELLDAIAVHHYWTIPAWRENPDTMDGGVLYLEGRRRNSYRVVVRDNFSDPAVERISKRLFELTQLKLETQ